MKKHEILFLVGLSMFFIGASILDTVAKAMIVSGAIILLYSIVAAVIDNFGKENQ